MERHGMEWNGLVWIRRGVGGVQSWSGLKPSNFILTEQSKIQENRITLHHYHQHDNWYH